MADIWFSILIGYYNVFVRLKKNKTDDKLVKKKRCEKTDDFEPSYINIQVSFIEILGRLSILTKLITDKNLNKGLVEVFNTILKWSADYEINRNLSLISDYEFDIILKKVEELNAEVLWIEQGNLSDTAYHWTIRLSTLREKQIQKKEGK